MRKKTPKELSESPPESTTNYVTVFYDIISDDGKEDGESVINIVASVLKNYKSCEANSHIDGGIIGSTKILL